MTKQANGLVDVDDLAARVAHELVAKEEKPTPAKVPPVPVPQAAWERLERLQLAAQVSQQQLQVFVDAARPRLGGRDRGRARRDRRCRGDAPLVG